MGKYFIIDRRRDPQGNFVALTTLSVWKLLEPKLSAIDDLDGVEVDFAGEKVLLKSKSRARLKAIMNKARALGISVSGSL